MNPFGRVDKIGYTDERKALKNELKLVLSKLFLNYAEELGKDFSFESLIADISNDTQAQLIWLKTAAFYKYSIQNRNISLSEDDKIAIAAHEAYKEVVVRSIGEEALYV